MPTKTKYIVAFILSVLLPMLLLVVFTFLNLAFAKDKAISFWALYALVPLLIFAGTFISNFWYAGILKISLPLKILAGFFGGIGLVFLLGYNEKIMSATSIIINCFEVTTKNLKKLIPFMVLLLIPSIILAAMNYIRYLLEKFRPDMEPVVALVVFALGVASLVFTIWVSAALAKTLKEIVEGQVPTLWKNALSQTSRHIGSLIFVSILVVLLVFLGAVAFVVPGIIFSVWFAFSFYSVLFEEKNGMGALKSSKTLVVGRWWEVAWRIFAPGLFFAFIILVLQTTLTWPLQLILGRGDVLSVIVGLISTILNSIFSPITACATVILYLNLKNSFQPTADIKSLPDLPSNP